MVMEWHDEMVSAFRAYITPILIAVGIPGNLLLIIAFVKLQKRSPCRFNLYVIWISVAHILDLVVNGLLDDFIGKGLKYATNNQIEIKFDDESAFSCKTLTFLTNISNNVASTLLLLFTVDRIITIYHPLKARGDRFITHAWIAILLNYLVAAVLFGPRFVYTDLEQDGDKFDCVYTDPKSVGAQYLILMEAIGSYTLPTFLILVLNILIAWKLRTLSVKQQSMCTNQTQRSHSEMRRILGHLGASTGFVLVSMPLVVTIILRLQSNNNNYDKTRKLYHERVVAFTKLCSSFKSLHYALEFWIYILFLPNVRMALIEIFCCGREIGKHKPDRRSHQTNYNKQRSQNSESQMRSQISYVSDKTSSRPLEAAPTGCSDSGSTELEQPDDLNSSMKTKL